MTNDDAVAEGFDSMESYQDIIMKMHKGMLWNPEASLWVHKFRRAEEACFLKDNS